MAGEPNKQNSIALKLRSSQPPTPHTNLPAKPSSRELRKQLTVLKTGLASLRRLGDSRRIERVIGVMEDALSKTTELVDTRAKRRDF